MIGLEDDPKRDTGARVGDDTKTNTGVRIQ